MGILSAYTVMVICLVHSGMAAELNNCDHIESCIKYSESGCDPDGRRTVCITWAPFAGCPLNTASDAIDAVCGQHTIGQALTTNCLKPPPVPENGNIPVLPATPVPIGTVVTAECDVNFRPASGVGDIIFTTCKSDGSYTPYSTNCIPITPVSCQCYFSRDNNFATATIGVDIVVSIDPPGPTGPVNVHCRKESATTFSTRVIFAPGNVGASYSLPAGPCTVDDSAIIAPVTTSGSADVTDFCDAEVAVTYAPATAADIGSIVATHPQGCTQTTMITCTNADSLALAVKFEDAPTGILFGTNAFENKPTDVGLSHYAYSGDACDCATASAVGSAANCMDGCVCTQTTPVSGMDTITKTITFASLSYVTSYQVAQHRDLATALSGGEFIMAVTPITCSATFVNLGC